MFDKIHFVKPVFKFSELPEVKLPELILCGRSNVGKSSFINSLFNKKNLAKTSSAPGKTRSINYYNVDDVFYIVDLPGFGYSKASQSERQKWSKLVSEFILSSENLYHAFHMLDSRHEPTELDLNLNQWLESKNKQYTLILNKADKLSQSEVHKSVNAVLTKFPHLNFNQDLFLYSSIDKKWKKSVLKRIAELFY